MQKLINLLSALALVSVLSLTSCKKEENKPTSFTIYDFSNTYSMIGDLNFKFKVSVGGSTPTRALVTVYDAAGNPLKNVLTDAYSNDQNFTVDVPLSAKSFIGDMTIKVSDEAGNHLTTATHELRIDTEINKAYTQLTKNVRVSGDVSAENNNYGDFADVVKIENAAIGDSVIVDFNHLSDPGKYADVYIYDANGSSVFSTISVANRGKVYYKLIGAGTYYVYVLFNSNAGFQEHWYWLTWK